MLLGHVPDVAKLQQPVAKRDRRAAFAAAPLGILKYPIYRFAADKALPVLSHVVRTICQQAGGAAQRSCEGVQGIALWRDRGERWVHL